MGHSGEPTFCRRTRSSTTRAQGAFSSNPSAFRVVETRHYSGNAVALRRQSFKRLSKPHQAFQVASLPVL
eukprot:3713070-Prorocentrum_lima.AAC.1